jgi:uncharacterized protein (TIGR02117 family)
MIKSSLAKTGKYLLLGLGIFVEAFLAFGSVYFIFAVLGGIIPNSGSDNKSGIQIFVKSNGIHTDVCVPIKNEQVNWFEFVPTEHFPKVEKFSYLSFGWGDKGFFLDTPTWADLKFSTAFNAAFLPTPTAMHVQYLEEIPTESETCKLVFVQPDKYLKLADFIKNSFAMKNGAIQLIKGKGYWIDDNFYEANGNYHMFYTCNSWTNDALIEADVTTGIYALFGFGIMIHLD